VQRRDLNRGWSEGGGRKAISPDGKVLRGERRDVLLQLTALCRN
jgi:hypothetical protein